MRTILALLAAAAMAAVPRAAAACTCEVRGSLVQLPANGATAVPPNARILVGNGWLPVGMDDVPPALVGPDGPVAVKAERLKLSQGFVHVLTPSSPLQPDATYQVTGLVGGQAEWHFATGDVTDEVPPPVPELAQVDAHYQNDGGGGSCGEMSDIVVAAKGDGELVILDVNGRATLEGLIGNASDAAQPLGGNIEIGNGGCLNNAQAKPGDRLDVRAASVDLAGNVSPWSAPLQTSFPAAGCGGCASSSGEALLPWLVLAAWARWRSVRRPGR